MSKKEDQVKEFIGELNDNITGIIAVAVVEVSSGMTLGHSSNDKAFNPEIASAYNVDVVKAKLKAIKALKISEKIDDILITLTDQYHLIKVGPNGNYMSYVAAKKDQTNLAIARSTINASFDQLIASI